MQKNVKWLRKLWCAMLSQALSNRWLASKVSPGLQGSILIIFIHAVVFFQRILNPIRCSVQRLGKQRHCLCHVVVIIVHRALSEIAFHGLAFFCEHLNFYFPLGISLWMLISFFYSQKKIHFQAALTFFLLASIIFKINCRYIGSNYNSAVYEN